MQFAGEDVRAKLPQSCPTLCDPMDCIARQAPLSMGFSGQEYCSGLPCPPPRDLPDPGAEHTSAPPPALAGRFLAASATWQDLSGETFIYSQLFSNSVLRWNYLKGLLKHRLLESLTRGAEVGSLRRGISD